MHYYINSGVIIEEILIYFQIPMGEVKRLSHKPKNKCIYVISFRQCTQDLHLSII